MGGDATAVSTTRSNVYVEAAFWWPKAVQGRSRRYNFSTDAGHRFERGVDPGQTVEHIERITQLIIDICGGDTAGPMDDQVVNVPGAASRHPARGARRQGDRHAAHAGAVPGRAPAPGLAGGGRRGHVDRDAAPLPLRPADRGRPHRRSGAHGRLQAAARPRRRWRPSRPSCARSRAQPLRRAPRCWPRWATRKPSTSASSKSAGSRSSPATPTRSSC
jgi:hypothetical protein